jgi:hypothetical protein
VLARAAAAAGEDMVLDVGETSRALLQMLQHGIDIFITISQLVGIIPLVLAPTWFESIIALEVH